MVLPWVPVTAIRVRACAGSPYSMRGEGAEHRCAGCRGPAAARRRRRRCRRALLVGEDRDRAGGDRVGGVRRAVGPAAGQGGVDVTRPDPLGAQGEPGDLDRSVDAPVGDRSSAPVHADTWASGSPRRSSRAGEVRSLGHHPRLSDWHARRARPQLVGIVGRRGPGRRARRTSAGRRSGSCGRPGRRCRRRWRRPGASDHDVDGEARLVGGREPGEGDREAAVVALALLADLLGGAGLAGHPVALDARRPGRCRRQGW